MSVSLLQCKCEILSKLLDETWEVEMAGFNRTWNSEG